MCYFAYGTNMAPREVKRWGLALGQGVPARLEGYRLDFTHYSCPWQSGAGDIVPDPASSVWGVLYPGVGEEVMRRLDEMAVAPEVYSRIGVTVTLKDGSRKKAVAYEATKKEGPFEPTRKYLGLYLEGARHYGLPEEWIAFLKDIPAQETRV
ncbi:MAG: gamma-glutamylcyclotransferase [Chloroflexi bacterium]|nr:gamma-glutamylcyclotransferase [Chloroflexota bacterium]